MKTESRRTFEYLPLSIRIETAGGVATPVVLRGTPLPATRSETFSTTADSQDSFNVELLIGESPLAKNNTKLGTFQLAGIPPSRRGEPQVKIEFMVRTDCVLTARARLENTDLFAEQVFEQPEDLSDDFIAKALASAKSNQEADQAGLLYAEVTNRAKSLIAKAELRLKTAADAKLSEATAALGLALASGKIADIRQQVDKLEKFFKPSFESFDFSAFFGSPQTRSAPQARRKPESQKPIPDNSQAVDANTLASQAHSHVIGKIFGGASFTLDTQLCFVLMPFAEKFQPLYEDHIKPTVERAGLRCQRADDVVGTRQITSDIWEQINRSRFLIAELTEQNPNVFYELGLAHALSKNVILLTQSMDFVPFDLRVIRCIVYDFTPRGTQKLESSLSETIAELMKLA